MKKPLLWMILWGGLLAGGLGGANAHKTSKDLDDQLARTGDPVDVVVQYQNDPSDQQLGDFGAQDGALLKDHAKNLRMVTFTAPPAAIQSLSNDPNVVYITPDRKLAAQFDYSEQAINAPYAWQLGLDGTGIGIALVDSGVLKHADLEQAGSHQSRVVYREIFFGMSKGNKSDKSGVKSDPFGHGTHVAGILAGNGKSSTGSGFTMTFKGVASNANLIDLVVMDQNGVASDSMVIAAISRAIELKTQYNIRVLNLSLGRPVYESSQ